MDDDFKWTAIMFIGITLALSLAFSVEVYSKFLTEKYAMENGYVQKLESGQKIWVKE